MTEDIFARVRRERAEREASMPFTRLATKAERKASHRKVVGCEAVVQTYRLYLKLECGHEWTTTCTAQKYREGFRGPKTFRCYTCQSELVARNNQKGESSHGV